MKKFLALASFMAISAALMSCGGGGGGTSGSANVGSESRSVNGGVFASVVANATVCLEDSQGNILADNSGNKLCAQSDANGTFTLQVPPDISLNDTQVALFAEDQNGDTIKIGETSFNNTAVDNETEVISITPLALADGNATLADDIGALVHALSGDTTGNATEVDLGDVDIENVTVVDENGTAISLNSNEESLEDLMRKKHRIKIKLHHRKKGNLDVEIDPNNSTVPVMLKVDKDGDNEFDEELHVSYNVKEKEKEWKEHLQKLLQKFQHHESMEESSAENSTEGLFHQEEMAENENSTAHGHEVGNSTEGHFHQEEMTGNGTAHNQMEGNVEQSENSTAYEYESMEQGENATSHESMHSENSTAHQETGGNHSQTNG